MFSLDIPTLRLAALLLVLGTLILLIFFWRKKHPEIGTTCWVGGLLSYSTAFLLVVFRDKLPEAMNVLIDLGLVASILLFLHGIRTTLGIAAPLRPYLLVAFVTLLYSAWFTFIDNDFRLRIVGVSLISAAISLEAVRHLLRSHAVRHNLPESVAALLFAFYALYALAKVGYVSFASTIDPNLLNIAFLASSLFVSALTITFILIAYSHLELAHTALLEQVKHESSLRIQGMEKRWILALEFSRAGAWEVNVGSGIAHFSSHWARLIGLPGTELELTTQQTMEYLHPDDRQQFIDDMRKVTSAGTGYFKNEHRLRKTDGSWIWVSSRGQLVQENVARESLTLIGTDTDITESKLNEQQLEQAIIEAQKARELAVQASKAKSTFLANVSHEIRSPMNAILGFSQLIMDDANLTPTQKENLEIINGSGQHLLSLIEDILNLSRIESGNYHISIMRLNPGLLFNEIVQFYLKRPIQPGVIFEPIIASDLPPGILADPKGIRQVCINLLSNAFKFTSKGHITFRVDILPVSAEQATLQIEVSDTGVGIGEEDLQIIFNPFEQTHFGVVSAEGYGLGLSICKNIINLLQGTLEVSSRLDQGTCFRLQLPVGLTPEKDVQHREQRQALSGRDVDLAVYRLLIVDDIDSNRKLLRQMLESSGIAIREAATAREALELIAAWHPSVVLMDIRMPMMSGDSAIAAIRSQEAFVRLPIIAVTANALQSERQRLLELGANDFISKPFSKEEIYRKLIQVLAVPQASGAQPQAAPGRDHADGAAAVPQPVTAQAASPRILVVDDNKANQQLLQSQLKALGYSADLAGNGQLGLYSWQQHRHRLVFVDCTMPVMNGFEMTERIRSAEREHVSEQPDSRTRIVAITGSPEEYQQRCAAAGMDALLGKPLLLNTLRQTLARLLPAADPAAPSGS